MTSIAETLGAALELTGTLFRMLALAHIVPTALG
jgi:hypothetical protein